MLWPRAERGHGPGRGAVSSPQLGTTPALRMRMSMMRCSRPAKGGTRETNAHALHSIHTTFWITGTMDGDWLQKGV